MNVAHAITASEARIKDNWRKLICANPTLSRLAGSEKLEQLQSATLREYAELLEASSLMVWTLRHEAHLAALRQMDACGFVLVLGYVTAAERAIFETLDELEDVEDSEIPEARARWRFLAQREMDVQCSSCSKICSLVSYGPFGGFQCPLDIRDLHNRPRGLAQPI